MPPHETAEFSQLQSLLEQAIAFEHADKGNVQYYDAERGELHIVAQSGFSQPFLDHFKVVRPFDTTSCGRAYGVGNTIAVDDVELDWGFQRHIDIVRAEGYRSVRSTPVLSEEGRPLGVISTHFKDPKQHWPKSQLQPILPQIGKLLSMMVSEHPAV